MLDVEVVFLPTVFVLLVGLVLVLVVVHLGGCYVLLAVVVVVVAV